MKRMLVAVFMFLGVLFQGASAPLTGERSSGTPDQRSTPESKRETQTEQERKMIQSRLRGLGYFQ